MVERPDPSSKLGLVEHILYLGGRGRKTPFTSTTESEEVATYFAGQQGAVWGTTVARAQGQGAVLAAGASPVPVLGTDRAGGALAREELLQVLRGFGKGRASWNNAWEVAQAAAYVKQWSEHVLDWQGAPAASIRAKIDAAFSRSK